jgi:hypothetical protein
MVFLSSCKCDRVSVRCTGYWPIFINLFMLPNCYLPLCSPMMELPFHHIVLLSYSLKELYFFFERYSWAFSEDFLHIRKCLNLRISHSIHTSYCLHCCVTYILARKLGIDRPITCNVTSGRTGDGDCMMDGWFAAALSQRLHHQQLVQGGESLTIT